jgi:IstB-like ATP binding protein
MAERLRGLGLATMADAFLDMHNQSAADDLSREDWLGLLIDREVTARDNKRLGRRLNLARLLARLMRSLERTRLLIIDDWGPEPLNAEQRRDLLEIVDDREGKGSLLITSQVPVGRWHEIIGDPTLGDAILDRVIHRSHRIEMKGESLRKRQALAAVESLTNAREK